MQRPWDGLISDNERAVYEAAGYGKRGTWGSRPALLVVDVNYNFTGDRPEPILESIKRFRNSCGEIAWQVIPRIAALLDVARHRGVPVIYSTQGYRPDALGAGSWGQKNSRVTTPSDESPRFGTEIVKEIAPRPDEIVVRKDKPSAFSYNYRVVVVEDCVFDRTETSHRANLFDLQSKHADVVPSPDVISYFEKLA